MSDLKYWEKIPPRPTTYKGIAMRSRLEARFAAVTDHHGWRWEYEPLCFADVYHPAGVSYYELKGWCVDAEPVKRQMEIVWSSEPDARLVFLPPASQCNAWVAVNGVWRSCG